MDEKIKVTVILKTYNNEDYLCNTLESIKDFEETIIIDEHSTDDTVEIAKEYKSKIIYADKNNLSLAYNQALNEATSDWILILEQNEIVPQKLIFEIQQYILNPKKNKYCVSFYQKYFYLGQELKSAQKKNVLRLFKKDYAELKNNYSLELKLKQGKIYKIKPNKNFKNACLLKFSENNIQKSLTKIIEDNVFSLKDSTSSNSSIIFKPIFEFIKYYIFKGMIFDKKYGYIYSKKRFIESFIFEVMLLEKEKKNDL